MIDPPDEQPFASFAEASRATLAYLRGVIPFDVWMVTHTDRRQWVVLSVDDGHRGSGVRVGASIPYEESLCSRMLANEIPKVVPDVARYPCHRAILDRTGFDIGAYISFPLHRDDGSLFGTLCALDRLPKDESVTAHEALLALLSRQLATILKFDLDREEAWRRALKSEADAQADRLSGLLNRRGWDFVCDREEQRARDFGHALSVALLDLDDLKRVNDRDGHAAGDRLIQTTGEVLRGALGPACTAARVGGDEFALLLPGIGYDSAAARVAALRERLEALAIRVSVGVAERKAHRGLAEALERADRAMYADKARRKGAIA